MPACFHGWSKGTQMAQDAAEFRNGHCTIQIEQLPTRNNYHCHHHQQQHGGGGSGSKRVLCMALHAIERYLMADFLGCYNSELKKQFSFFNVTATSCLIVTVPFFQLSHAPLRTHTQNLKTNPNRLGPVQL
jgi:hypothetical protein